HPFSPARWVLVCCVKSITARRATHADLAAYRLRLCCICACQAAWHSFRHVRVRHDRRAAYGNRQIWRWASTPHSGVWEVAHKSTTADRAFRPAGKLLEALTGSYEEAIPIYTRQFLEAGEAARKAEIKQLGVRYGP